MITGAFQNFHSSLHYANQFKWSDDILRAIKSEIIIKSCSQSMSKHKLSKSKDYSFTSGSKMMFSSF